MPLCHTRIKTFGEFMELADFFFVNNLSYSQEVLCPKKISELQACYVLQGVIWRVEQDDDWSSQGLKQASYDVAKMFGVNHKKIVMAVLFAAIMGKKCGLPLFDSTAILGKDRTRARLLGAMSFLGGLSEKKRVALKKVWDAQDCSKIWLE